MKLTLFIILAGLVIIGLSQLVGSLAGETIGNLVFFLLCIVAFFVIRHWSRRQREAEHFRPTRKCPFCEQGTLTMQPGTGVAYQQGRRTVWFYTWKCDRCNNWQIADLVGNPLPQTEQEK